MTNLNQNLIETINSIQGRADAYRSTSAKYAIVPTQDLIARVNNVLDGNQVAVDSTKLIKAKRALKGSSHAVEFTLRDNLDILGDAVKPRIIIVNSYNGEKALTVLCGIFRLVCFNGLVVGSTLYRERAIHIQGETLDMKLDALETRVNDALIYIHEKLTKDVAGFLSIETDRNAQIDIVKRLNLSKRLTERLEYAFLNPQRMLRPQDQGLNAWATYNVINEMIRRYSQSDLSNLQRNVNLMDNVRELSLKPDVDYRRVA